MLGKSCFMLSGIEEITLPLIVMTIEKRAFYGCQRLRHVTFGERLYKIESEAFKDTGLESVKFPFSLREIGCDAFAGCTHLASVRIQEGVRAIRS